MFDIENAMRAAPPAPAKPWAGFPEFNFVGGHNDADSVPAAALAAAVAAALTREGASLATYGLQSGPQGFKPFREAIAAMLQARTAMPATADQVLVTSGSLQALDLVFNLSWSRATSFSWRRPVMAARSPGSGRAGSSVWASRWTRTACAWMRLKPPSSRPGPPAGGRR